jgi:hypothetical protein
MRDSGEKNYIIDKHELAIRALWLAKKITNKVILTYGLSSCNVYEEERSTQTDYKIIIETICYTMAFFLWHLRDEIEANHGWSDKTFDLNTSYQLTISVSFDKYFNMAGGDHGLFYDLFEEYYLLKQDNGYKLFWDIDEANDIEDDEETITNSQEFFEHVIKDILTESPLPPDTQDYPEMLYAYRLSKCIRVVDRNVIISLAKKTFRDIGISFYESAFFDLSLKRMIDYLNEIDEPIINKIRG